MTNEELKLIKELIQGVSVALDGLVAISKLATETVTKLAESTKKASDTIHPE